MSSHASKSIASRLNLTVSTVNNHRANIMKKLGVDTLADLARIALTIEPGLVTYKNRP